jgi:HAD superfamily hydrolase (TIGR01549 family)
VTGPDLAAIDILLFDFYGTLGQSYTFHYEEGARLIYDSLRRAGVEVREAKFLAAYRRALDHHQKEMMTTGRESHNTSWVADALAELGVEASPDTPMVVEAIDAYFDRYSSEIEIYPDVEESLDQLESRYRLGLVSNFTDPRPVRRVLERTGIASRFETIVVSAEVGIRKPWPGIFEAALKEMGAAAGECLYVGDHPVADVEGPRKLGMATARLTRPEVPPDWYQPWGDLESYEEADLVFEDMRELCRALLDGGVQF